MALIGSGGLSFYTIGKIGNGNNSLAAIRGYHYQTGQILNSYDGDAGFSRKSGTPSGYRHPASWCLPIKDGGLSSRFETDIEFSESASIVGGKNAEGSATLTFTLDATGGLVVSGSGTATITFTPDGTVIAVAPGVGTASISFAPSADIGAIADLLATATLTFTPSADPHAIGYLEGTSSSDAEFSADNLAAAVWNALAASYNTPGTMGEKLNDAGSASNPWTEVIEGTYTAEQILRIIASALAGKVSGAGTGTETFKGLDGTTDRIVSTVDDDGNRTDVVVDGT